ncbi:MAG: hypothetical protein JWM82_4371 [Myxococcales bacterium]|jgi:hypothetical protein|nr:hypothetical protein [Myxococcales bacterium]
MDDKEDSIPFIEIDPEPSDPNAPGPSRKTTPHASVDWMTGFDEGRQRGSAEVLEALEAALVAVGVGEDVAKVIVRRVRNRAEEPETK